jgi:hypothetical protein
LFRQATKRASASKSKWLAFQRSQPIANSRWLIVNLRWILF